MTRKHRADFLIPFLTLILMAIGLVVIYTIGPVRAKFLEMVYGGTYGSNYFVVHQLIMVIASVVMFVVFYKLDFKIIRKWTTVFMLFALGACAVLMIGQVVKMPFVKCELGACRWFQIGPISAQPAELLKLGLALYLPQLVADYKKEGKLWKKDFWLRFLGASALSLFFVVVMQKDLGSALPIAVEMLAILLVAGVSMKIFWLIVGVMGILGIGVIITSPHRMQRVMTYIGMGGSSSEVDSEADSDSYHIENALIAIGSGGLFGVGVGNSVQATGYLPESINDSVFAIMGETFGFVGLVVVIALFAILLMRILKIADTSPDQQMNLVAIGAFAWLMTHVVVNIAAMTDLAPLTGITLPLLSYGGTSMLCVASMLGIVMQISQYTSGQVILDGARKAEVEVEDGVRSRSTRMGTAMRATGYTPSAHYAPGAQRISRRRRE